MEVVLSMECEDGKWRLVAFLSKSLNKTERNYKIHNKKILAVSSYKRVGKLEIFIRGHKVQVQGLDRL